MSLRTARQTALELSGLQKKLHAYSHALALLYVDGVTAARRKRQREAKQSPF